MTYSIHSIDLPAPALIALVGAGGKTSTAFWLARILKNNDCRVLVTTTTRMFKPETTQCDFIYLAADEQSLLAQLAHTPNTPAIHYCAACHDPASGKVDGLPSELISSLKNSGQFDVLIVEADGSRRLPLKAPARHEPCIPADTDLVIAVSGAEALLAPADPAQIHRWAEFSTLTGCQPGEVVGLKTLDRLLGDPHGFFKSTPPQSKRIWLINKLDLSPCPSTLCTLSEQLLSQHTELTAIWLTNMQDEQPLKHNFQKSIAKHY